MHHIRKITSGNKRPERETSATETPVYDAEPLFVKAIARSIKISVDRCQIPKMMTVYKMKAARPATATIATPPACMLEAAPVKADTDAVVTLVLFLEYVIPPVAEATPDVGVTAGVVVG
jgi:hypothetical protein